MTTKAEKRVYMKTLHDGRRDEKKCINNAKHGKAHKGGRCKPCWSSKLKGERTAYAKRKAAAAAAAEGQVPQ